MPERMMPRTGLVVGTAGHIDHGKTSLVRALTGIDTDRLPDEKRRGISIDLGFAHLDLDDGQTVSFIDVPGHERFVRNMLAGASGVQAVMLIVAATEGVMPQTREHFEICRLLGIKSGFVVLTKADLASPAQIELATHAIRDLCAGSFLEQAPIVPCSAVSGSGLDEVRQNLRLLIGQTSLLNGGLVPRLWIDRGFVKKGFGTVVTGTLASGILRAGDDILIFPKRKSGRIRSMQTHGNQVELGVAGQRTAINLSGLDSSQISRGDVLTIPSEIRDSFVLDAWIEWLDLSDLPAGRTNFLLHIGSAELTAAVKVLEAPSSGHRTFARIWMPSLVLSLPRDRFILRRLSPVQTVAGGEVLEIAPPLRFNKACTLRRLAILAGADDGLRVETLVTEAAAGKTLSELQRATGLTFEVLRELTRANPHLLLCEPQRVVVAKAWLGERRNRLANWLAAYHKQNPSSAGAPLAQARLGLRPDLAEVVFDKNPTVKVTGDLVSLSTHKALLSEEETAALAHIESTFRSAGFQPPPVAEVLNGISRDTHKMRGMLEFLLKNKRLVRVADDLIFHADVIAHVRNSLAAHRGRRFSVSEFKDWTQMSRKYAIPMLEYLDREHVTRREGEQRVIL